MRTQKLGGSTGGLNVVNAQKKEQHAPLFKACASTRRTVPKTLGISFGISFRLQPGSWPKAGSCSTAWISGGRDLNRSSDPLCHQGTLRCWASREWRGCKRAGGVIRMAGVQRSCQRPAASSKLDHQGPASRKRQLRSPNHTAATLSWLPRCHSTTLSVDLALPPCSLGQISDVDA